MTFLWPAMLWLLIALPLLVVLYLRVLQRRRQFAIRYGDFGWLKQDAARQSHGPGIRSHIPAILFLLGIGILLFALSRPQMTLSLPKREGIVVLAFDTSGSMAAEDVEPSRLEAAKLVASEFVASQPSVVRIGVVAFSDGGFSVQPPTGDDQAILAALDRLGPQRSTSLANGILVAMDTIDKLTLQAPEDPGDFPPELVPAPAPAPPGTTPPFVIVLISDGENTTNPDPLEAARQAARRGVRIHTIGVGHPNGTTLEVEGFLIHTQLDEAMLREIASLTGGNYYSAASQDDLRVIYEQIEPQIVVRQENTEITALLAGLSILLLLIGGLLSLVWFGHMP